MAIKLTKNDIDRIIPQLEKEAAIEQDKKFKKEFEESKKQYEKIIEQMSEACEQDAKTTING